VGTLISGKAAAKGLDLVFDVADDVPIDVRGDPWRLVQILANYANNAVKFTETGEVAILVRLVEDDGDSIVLRFAVRDTGIGLTGDQKRMLFRSFSQADSSTTRKYGGSGLGLAISKRLAQLMGGAVGVDSELGKGSTFWFTAKLGKGSPRPSLDVRPELRAKRVLVVEDNDNARTMLARMLSDMTFHVEVADSGDAALAAIEAANLAGAAIELVLFDCRMPDMAGLETAARMRTTFAESCPRLVMVAPYAHESMVTRADPIGIDGILIKPVTASSLFDCIMRVFGDSRAERTRRAKSSDMPADDVISALRGAKILLAEDNHLNQRVACEMLQGVGLEVEVAENGAIAVAMAQSARFDLILMDMQMPVLDGVTATREIRNLAVPTPIVAMTANAFQSDRDTCIAAGMNDYLAKPINPTALVAVLAKWVKRGGATPPAEAYPAQSLDSATLRMVSSRLGMFLYDRSDQARDVWSSNANLLKAAFPAHFEEIDRAIGEGDYERALTLLDRALAPPRPPGLPDIDPAVFDFDRIGPIYGWDVEALHDALDGFVDDADGKRAAIETALAGGQVERTREVAHALKGIAGVTGATRLAKSASQLEIAARTGRIDDANRLAPEIGPAVAELREALDRFFSCRADGETECLKRTSGN
jgi:CheY-like chemotaxis protein/HPt (histidine-containing phosphotransfer) domain-containing protein